MELDSDKLLQNAIQDGIREGIKAKLTGYNSPLDKLLTAAIEANAAKFRTLLEESISTCVANEDFRKKVRDATQRTLAKTLVQRFGGEIEKQVNALKSDPTTRARITLAIEEIVKTQPH